MDAVPWQFNPVFTKPVKNVFIGDGMLVVEHSDGSKQTILFLAPGLPPDPIVGRQEEFLVLKQRLCMTGTTNQHAIIGLPAIGKTTLATMLAWDSEILKRFPGGVLWASLGPYGDPDAQLSRWARVLRVDLTKEPMLDTRIDLLRVALKGQPFLFVLDDVWNEEHVEILSQVTGPGCAHLFTTRDETIARTFAPYDNILRMGELTQEQSVQLLGTFSPEMKQQPTELNALARAVGGLPLALCLMGGYLRVHVTFAGTVQQSLDVLLQGKQRLVLRDVKHPMTLQQVIDLSVQALPDESSRQAFARMGAFAPKPEIFSLDAAQEVAETDLATLGLLVRRNLLEKVGEERVTIHQVLADAASLPPGSPTIRRHADYYFALLKNKQQLIGFKDDRVDWGLFALELPQMRHAWNAIPDADADRIIAFVFAIRGLLNLQGLWRELIIWSERGVRAAQEHEQEKQAAMLNDLGVAHFSLGQNQAALDYTTQALALSEAHPDRAGQSMTLNNLGRIYEGMGEWQQALTYFTQTLQLMEGMSTPSDQGIVLYNIGRIYHAHLRDHKQALVYMMRALSLLKADNHLMGIADVCVYLGGMSNALGERRWALRWLQEALVILEGLNDRPAIAETLRLMGNVHSDLGDQERAEEYEMKALSLLEAVDNPAKHAEMQRKLAADCYQRGNYQQTLQHAQKALPFYEAVNNQSQQTKMLILIGRAYHKLEDFPLAVQFAERALTLHDARDDLYGIIVHNIGEAYQSLKEQEKALDYYRQALAVREAIGDERGQSTTLHNIGTLYNEQEEYIEGLDYLQRALALRKAIGWLSAERITLLGMSVSFYNLFDLEELERVMTRVVELSQALNDPELDLDRSQLEQVQAERRRDGI